MSQYFPDSTDISSTHGYRTAVRRQIDEYVKRNYEADSPRDDGEVELISRINRNSWEARYNVNLQSEEEFRNLVQVILEIVEEGNSEFKSLVEENIAENEHRDSYDCDDVRVFIEVITTDSRDQHNGYSAVGTGSGPSDLSELNLDLFGESSYPLPALDVSVDFNY